MSRGIVVALLGLDGAGKSSVAAAVAGAIPDARIVYGGLWQRPRPENRPRVPGSELARRLALAWGSAARARYHRARGRVVILDRSTQDALLGIRHGQAWRDRLYFTALARSGVTPDLAIVLDVDAATAFARKGEHDPAFLEATRREYLRLAVRLPNTKIVDASRPLADVRDAVVDAIRAVRDGRRLPPGLAAADPATLPRLRILFVTPGLTQPPSDGFSLRVDGLVRELARRHDVRVLRFDGPDGPEAVRQLAAVGVTVRLVRPEARGRRAWKWLSVLTPRSYRSRYFHDPAMQRAIDRELRSGLVDVVQLESTELCAYDLGPITAPPVVLDTHNVHAELLRRVAADRRSLGARLYWRLEAAKFGAEERACWRAVDACVMTSERESRVVAATPGVRRVVTVPNAVDVARFRPAEGDPGGAEIVFTGLLSYLPNEDAVAWFVREVLPSVVARRPDAHLTVVGKEAPPRLQALAGPHVTFTGYVDDVRPYLARAAVAVAPLRAGSGTRLKILEALAMGKAIVSTTVGAEGLDVTPGRELLVADEPAAMAAAVVRVLGDAGLRRDLGAAGRAFVERHHGWPAAAAALERVYAALVPTAALAGEDASGARMATVEASADAPAGSPGRPRSPVARIGAAS